MLNVGHACMHVFVPCPAGPGCRSERSVPVPSALQSDVTAHYFSTTFGRPLPNAQREPPPTGTVQITEEQPLDLQALAAQMGDNQQAINAMADASPQNNEEISANLREALLKILGVAPAAEDEEQAIAAVPNDNDGDAEDDGAEEGGDDTPVLEASQDTRLEGYVPRQSFHVVIVRFSNNVPVRTWVRTCIS